MTDEPAQIADTQPSNTGRRGFLTAVGTLSALPILSAMAASALAALEGSAAHAEVGPTTKLKGGQLLTAFFTRSGNTRVIAGTLQRKLGADLFEIQAARPYPEDYEATVEQARKERDAGIEPALAARVPNLRGYKEIFLGFPIWGETAPPIIRSFLKAHDFSGMTLHPFITHGGYGIGSSMEVLKSHALGAKISEPFVLEADQERRTIEQVSGWLKGIDAPI